LLIQGPTNPIIAAEVSVQVKTSIDDREEAWDACP
jgi:hypothetical protein